MTQRIDLLKAVALNFDDLILDGVPASLTGSTIDHLSLIHPLPNSLQGADFYIYSGAGAGQERTVGSFNSSNRRMCFPQVFASIPSINSNFILTMKWAKTTYDNAISRAIGAARIKNLQETVATTAIVGTQYEYPVPSGMEYISNLRLVPTANSDYAGDTATDVVFEIPPRFWRIEKNVGGSYVIAIDARKIGLDDYDGHIVRINGQSKPDIQGTDNATIPETLEEYLIGQSSLQMASLLGDGLRTDPRFYMYRDVVKGVGGSPGLEAYIVSTGRGKRVG